MKGKTIFKEGKEIVSKYTNKGGELLESHIKKRAIKRLNEKLESMNISKDDIEIDDYEAMLSDNIKDIKKEYAIRTSKGLLAILGLDFFTGL